MLTTVQTRGGSKWRRHEIRWIAFKPSMTCKHIRTITEAPVPSVGCSTVQCDLYDEGWVATLPHLNASMVLFFLSLHLFFFLSKRIWSYMEFWFFLLM